MGSDNTIRFSSAFGLVLMAVIAALVQMKGYVNLDDAWLIDAARRVVGGEILNVDVVETNPPLIVYIMTLPVYAARMFGVGVVDSFVVFTALLGISSCALCFTQVKDPLTRMVLAFVIFLLPTVSYGEREHFLLMLILPYFILQINRHRPRLAYVIAAGVLAGIGFSIKPFFVIIWLGIVLCRWLVDRKIFSFENFLIGAIGVTYLAYLFFVEKNYVHDVLPLLLKYYGNFGINLLEALKQSAELIIAFQVAVLVLLVKDRKLLDRPIVFSSAACIASILMLILQAKTWLNYFYPPLFFSFLTNIFIIIRVFDHLKPLWNKAVMAISCITVLLLLTYVVPGNLDVAYSSANFKYWRMVRVIDQNTAGQTAFALSFDLGALYPAIVYSQAENISRYGHLWMLPGMYAGRAKNGEMVYRLPSEMRADEAWLFTSVVDEMLVKKPRLVVVSAVEHEYVNDGEKYKFDFIKYFSGDPQFRNFWHDYKKIAHVDYQDVYLRNAPVR